MSKSDKTTEVNILLRRQLSLVTLHLNKLYTLSQDVTADNLQRIAYEYATLRSDWELYTALNKKATGYYMDINSSHLDCRMNDLMGSPFESMTLTDFAKRLELAESECSILVHQIQPPLEDI